MHFDGSSLSGVIRVCMMMIVMITLSRIFCSGHKFIEKNAASSNFSQPGCFSTRFENNDENRNNNVAVASN